MSQKNFRDQFLDHVLNYLWRQWSALGILGESVTGDQWLIDPEPLLCFTLEISRFEPRLFDEVMDWLIVNGRWIDIQRLRGILQTQNETVKKLVGASASFLSNSGFENGGADLAKPTCLAGQGYFRAKNFLKAWRAGDLMVNLLG